MTRLSMRVMTIVLTAAGLVAVASTWFWLSGREDCARIALGRALYVENCATCHGAQLEGQPNWMERLPNGRMPAPPHDASGHTWHHSNQELFLITKGGLAAVVPGYESDMPGFGDTLTDEEIRAVLAFIKSTWPERQRDYHEARRVVGGN
jgi:mono/diheme cytochrome c family protein